MSFLLLLRDRLRALGAVSFSFLLYLVTLSQILLLKKHFGFQIAVKIMDTQLVFVKYSFGAFGEGASATLYWTMSVHMKDYADHVSDSMLSL